MKLTYTKQITDCTNAKDLNSILKKLKGLTGMSNRRKNKMVRLISSRTASLVPAKVKKIALSKVVKMARPKTKVKMAKPKVIKAKVN